MWLFLSALPASSQYPCPAVETQPGQSAQELPTNPEGTSDPHPVL